MVHDFLSPQSIAARGYFDAPEIQRMVDADEAWTQDNTYRIWALLTLEMWHRTFIDKALVR